MNMVEGYLDTTTVIVFGLLMKMLLAGLFFVFWSRSPRRRAIWFAWWGVALLLGNVAAGNVIWHGFHPDFLGLGITGAALVATFGCCWQGARAFERRQPLWLPLAAATGGWLAFSLVPDLFEHAPYRVIVSSLLASGFLMLTAFEFWRGRSERLASRWMMIALCASLALVFAIRIPLVNVAPFPFGALPASADWLAAYNMIMFFHTVILVVLMVAMTKERLELEQRTVANTDPLTGAMNRRALESRGRRLLARHERDGQELCALFLDIDDFKRINDLAGHIGGDLVLKSFVEITSNAIRPTDFLFRVGGEEFCCLLPQTDAQQGRRVAERIRQQVEAFAFDAKRSRVTAPLKVTVSIGVASTALAGYDIDALLREADGAVYAAKRLGRNRVIGVEVEEMSPARALA
jgi:diguanylate cyclase (GGDEF)-like protein